MKRILPNTVVRCGIQIGLKLCMKEWSPITPFTAKIAGHGYMGINLWFGKSTVQSAGDRNTREAWIGILAVVKQVKSYSKWHKLFTKRQNFSPFQVKSICRRQNHCGSKLLFERVETLLQKEKMLVTSIFSVSNSVFKFFFFFLGPPKLSLCGKV